MDHLKLERASYCGLSIGGMVGQWLGGNHPERIDKLVCDRNHRAYLGDPIAWLERAATVRAAGTVEVIADAGRRALVHARPGPRRTARR